MRTITELFQGYDITWKIVVSPKGIRDDSTLAPTVRFWTPQGQPEDRMLIYSPKIVITAKYRVKKYDDPKEAQNHESASIPINMIYTFVNRLRTVYQSLSDSKLFHKDAYGNIIMDRNLAIQYSKKLALFTYNLVISPSIIYYGDSQGFGVVLTLNGKTIGRMTHNEIKEFCEIVDHTDFQVYSVLLTLLEKNCDMDDKLNKIQGDIGKILSILKDQGKDITNQKPAHSNNSDLIWNNLPQREGDFLL